MLFHRANYQRAVAVIIAWFCFDVLLALSGVQAQTPQLEVLSPKYAGSFSTDLTIWPNQTSWANSDSWLAMNHQKIRLMKPRVLLINFSNDHSAQHLLGLADKIVAALAESSRYHGYAHPNAPAFLEYEIVQFVDLRDGTESNGNSLKLPVKDPEARSGFNVDYSVFFSEPFAKLLNIRDPLDSTRCLTLPQLLDMGWVHEVWFFESGSDKSRVHSGAFEVVELKPKYDEKFQKVGNGFVQAGNGGDEEQKWTGRSCRIGCINASRGVGCFLESLAHGMEGTASSGSIPYFSRYFREYAGYDLRTRYELPFDSFYSLDYRLGDLQFPTSSTLQVVYEGKTIVRNGYIAAGGNAHFPPNGRKHYDLDNSDAVLSTIEDWRIGSGADGADLAQPFTSAKFERYRDLAPDCMGSWLVYWRQNMPGLDNRQRDAQGQPMKNWLPFLFY
jgi:hypothetical protein